MYGRTRGNWLSQIRATKKFNENRKIEPWRMWLVECQLNVIMPTSKVKKTSQRKVVEVHVPVPVWSMYWKFIHLDARVPKMLPGAKTTAWGQGLNWSLEWNLPIFGHHWPSTMRKKISSRYKQCISIGVRRKLFSGRSQCDVHLRNDCFKPFRLENLPDIYKQ